MFQLIRDPVDSVQICLCTSLRLLLPDTPNSNFEFRLWFGIIARRLDLELRRDTRRLELGMLPLKGLLKLLEIQAGCISGLLGTLDALGDLVLC